MYIRMSLKETLVMRSELLERAVITFICVYMNVHMCTWDSVKT